ncbi:ABC transporter permease [Pseudemcibacter aquimaris]|uniref:ABC transporter permease n=1 Tax=Pseudemcibacter aquimaris TaxID=2857064 RepID=UPI002012086D|nr:ABC transporter permease [Pseudemcibacter aquimaris]MCC3859907.1 ABC transporter permease [Pseudemcibacter aquimaris]WDU57239.1 ABC transporter permease [Pseudemcibacter aquimaris]
MLIGNYFKSAYRNLLGHKLFTFINIMGLAIGLAAVMLITLFVKDELSFDAFWEKSDSLYRIHVQFDVPGKDPEYYNSAPPPMAAALKEDFPEIEHVARFLKANTVAHFGNERRQIWVDLVDPDAIDMFELNFIHGSAETALPDRNSIIVDQTQATKLFGDKNPIGETLTIELGREPLEYKVTGVFEDTPTNTMVPLQGITLFNEDLFGGNMLKAWYRNFTMTFIHLRPGASIENVEAKMPDFISRHYPRVPFAGPDTKPEDVVKITAMNIKDLHLNIQGESFEFGPKGDKTTVMIFSVIAFLILVIASINFMNLSTARSSIRAKEVAIRKVMGATRKNLIFQFLGESILLTIFALAIALIIVEGTLPFYNDVISKEMDINYMSADLIYIFLFTVFIGLLGGLYPSFVLSRFHPAMTLKANKSNESKASIRFRSILVVVQFSISIALFVSTGVIYAQMKYAQSKDLGYDREHLLTVFGNDRRNLIENIDIIVERLYRQEGVLGVTYSDSGFPGTNFEFLDPIRIEKTSDYEPIMLSFRQVGYDFMKTHDIPLIAGRDYERGTNDERPTNDMLAAGEGYTASLVLNKSAVRKLGFGTPEEALGRLMYMNVGRIDNEGSQEILEAEFEVIGVIDDVHFNDLKTEVQPEFYQLFHKRAYFVIIRWAGDPMAVLDRVRNVWNSELPGASFEYRFSKDALAEQYARERGEMTMFAAFSTLAIFIACLGLFGLASFTAERRTKEIGIRKVMGASIWKIIKLLVFEFSKPVIVANIIAWPVAYLAMSKWLDSFVYRIDGMIIIALCLIAGLTALLIAWATVAGNSYAVAKENPIKALRYE